MYNYEGQYLSYEETSKVLLAMAVSRARITDKTWRGFPAVCQNESYNRHLITYTTTYPFIDM